jgi:hypothetical protein
VSRRVSKVHFDAAARLDRSIGYGPSAMPPLHQGGSLILRGAIANLGVITVNGSSAWPYSLGAAMVERFI